MHIIMGEFPALHRGPFVMPFFIQSFCSVHAMPHIRSNCIFNFHLQLSFKQRVMTRFPAILSYICLTDWGRNDSQSEFNNNYLSDKKAPVDNAHLHCLPVSVCLGFLYIFHEVLVLCSLNPFTEGKAAYG